MATGRQPTKPLTNAEAYLNLVRVHNRLTASFAELFRSKQLTPAQYNVLRILRGGPRKGTPCQHIGEQLITRVPDVTRLLDRMETAGLLARSRSDEDRRVVLVRLTKKGRKQVDDLDEPVETRHRAHFVHMKATDIETLNRLLQEVLEGS